MWQNPISCKTVEGAVGSRIRGAGERHASCREIQGTNMSQQAKDITRRKSWWMNRNQKARAAHVRITVRETEANKQGSN